MAALTTRLTDSDPARTYLCPGCRHDLQLGAFRLLYRGTKRVLRCRTCEAAAASPDMARYYLHEFERHRTYKRQYGKVRPEVNRAARARYNAAHAEEVREYKQGWYQVNRERQIALSKQHYRAHAAERNARSKAVYAARCRTPEALAARQSAKEQRRADARAAWRLAARSAVAAMFGTTPETLLQPACQADRYLKHARELAIYVPFALRRPRDRHPLQEVADEYHATPAHVQQLEARLRKLIWHRRTNGDGEWYHDVLQAVGDQLLQRKPARARRRKAS